MADQAWIFQANPARYRIFESLAQESEEFWNLNQHADDVKPGDRVLIWVSGDEAGIYAEGTVLSDSVIMADSPAGQSYWIAPEDGRRARARVRVQYDREFLERPLRKQYLLADPDTRSLRILRNPRGTNFRVSPSEWKAIRTWLDDL